MNGGYKATPHIVKRITDADGKVLYENKYDNPPRVLSEEIAATMNSMLSRVITEGTGKAAKLQGWQAAGKSGTTQSFRDALFVGYTSNLTTGVWFGNDDGTSMKKVTGGGLPAKAWKDFMTAAHSGLSPSPLFGLGAGGVPPLGEMQQPAPENPPSSIGDIISNALGAGRRIRAPIPKPPLRRTRISRMCRCRRQISLPAISSPAIQPATGLYHPPISAVRRHPDQSRRPCSIF